MQMPRVRCLDGMQAALVYRQLYDNHYDGRAFFDCRVVEKEKTPRLASAPIKMATDIEPPTAQTEVIERWLVHTNDGDWVVIGCDWR